MMEVKTHKHVEAFGVLKTGNHGCYEGVSSHGGQNVSFVPYMLDLF